MNTLRQSWLVRGKPSGVNREKEFFEKNIFGTGWGGIGDLTGLSREEIVNRLKAHEDYGKDGERKIGISASVLNYIVNEISVGDYLLMPDGNDIYLGIVTREYEFDESKDERPSYSHQIAVKWEKVITRDSLPLEIRNSLRAWQTIADLNKHTDKISGLFTGDLDDDSVKFISGMYPLRENLSIEYKVPADMTKEEAERYGNFIKTLYNIED